MICSNQFIIFCDLPTSHFANLDRYRVTPYNLLSWYLIHIGYCFIFVSILQCCIVLLAYTATMFQALPANLLTIYSLFQFLFFDWFIVYSKLLVPFFSCLIFDNFPIFLFTLNSQ